MRRFIQILLDGAHYVAVADDGTVWRTVEWDASTHRVSWECISTTPQQEVKP